MGGWPMQLVPWQTDPIGIDLGHAMVKACQFARRGSRGLRLQASLRMARMPGESLASIVARLSHAMSRHEFIGSRVVVSAPLDAQFVNMLDVPPSTSGAPLDTIVRLELARTHKRDPESFEFTWWELPTSGQSRSESASVIAAGLPHEHAASLLDTLENAGFRVDAVDLASQALVRGCGPALLPSPGINALVDIGWLRPLLVLLQGTTVVYQRELSDVGLSRLQVKLKERLKIDDEAASVLLTRLCLEETNLSDPDLQLQLEVVLAEHASKLARELELSLRYADHRYPGANAKRLVLCGGGASLPGLSSMLKSSLGCDVVTPKLQDLTHSGGTGAPAARGDFALSAGLALHAMASREAAA